LIFGIILAVVALGLVIQAVRVSLANAKRKRLSDEYFRKTMSGLDLQYLAVKKQLYAYGSFDGLSVCFHYGACQFTWPAPDRTLQQVGIFCRAKIPGTAGINMTMGVSSSNRPANKLPFFLGWLGRLSIEKKLLSPGDQGDGFSISTASGKFTKEINHRITRETKDKLRDVAERHKVGCAVTKNWEKVSVGERNALTLAGGDEQVMKWLDLRTTLPLVLDPGVLQGTLEIISGAAKALGNDLQGLE
jgi:hypothetical protein